MRVLAVDYGDRRTGLAFSDLGGVLCGEAFTVEEWDPERLAGRIADECRTRGAGRIVLGLPKNMDGTEGPRAETSGAAAWRRTPSSPPTASARKNTRKTWTPWPPLSSWRATSAPHTYEKQDPPVFVTGRRTLLFSGLGYGG